MSKQDIGNYTCTAKNEFGSDTKKISVQVMGEITFIAEPTDIVTTRGSNIKLKCEAEGITISFCIILCHMRCHYVNTYLV